METKINTISSSEHELEVTLGYDEIKNDLEKIFREEGKKISIPGFRKGKAPVSMIKKMYGDAIEYQASEKIANKKFWEIVDEQKLNPISTPKMVDLNYEKESNLSFKIRYEVKPELEVKDYTGQEVKKVVFTATDDMIEEEVKHLLRTNAVLEDAEEVEDKNCQLTVDLQKIDTEGNPEAGVKSENINVDLTDERVNPDLVNNAIGKKTGETFQFTFHNDREIEENGEKKTIHEDFTYETTIKSIKKIVLPEFNDEFVKKVTKEKFSNPEDFKKDIKDGIQKYYDRQSEDIFLNSLLNMVVKNNDFEPPHGYVHFMLDRMVKIEEERAKRGGQKRFDAKEASNRLHKQAEWSAKWQIIMENLAKKENISVDESELKELAEKESAEMNISVEKLMKYYQDINRSESLLEEKVIDFLKKNNNIIEVNSSENQTNENEG